MSTRWYPIYQKGGPQLRIFLPNFWMKIIRPTEVQPPNVVQFSCSIEMTKHDIRNYLQKIYNIKCVDVRTRICMPRTRKDPIKGYIIKDDDMKYAYVTLPKDEKFTFPELYKDEKKEKELEYEKTVKEFKSNYKVYLKNNKKRPDMPGWFSI